MEPVRKEAPLHAKNDADDGSENSASGAEQLTSESKCWCGNSELSPFSPGYLRCSKCETLVVARMLAREELLVQDDSESLYGAGYFDRLAKEFGHPGLEDRARIDLAERCAYWLRALLKYIGPPARVLELGSAHGGFVGLLREAGFDATGLDMSPKLVEAARKRFEIPMLTGPVEQQELQPESLDVIALMDVLEHLGDPAGTVRHCAGLLGPKGFLLAQTPRYTEGITYEELVASNHPFLEQLKPEQHLFLFSKSSLEHLFQSAGFLKVVFEPAIFAHYDQFAVAMKEPIEPQPRVLKGTRQQRVAQALLDARSELETATARSRESEKTGRIHVQMVQDVNAQAAELRKQAEARAQGLRELTSVIAVRDQQIISLQQVAEERLAALEATDKEVKRLAGVSEQQARDVQTLTAAIGARDEQIGQLRKVAEERLAALETTDAALKALAAESEQQVRDVHTLTRIVAARQERIGVLEQIAEERLAALLAESAARAELFVEADLREQGLHELTRVIAGRDERIAALEGVAEERLAALLAENQARTALQVEAGLREQGLHELTRAIAERDERIAALDAVAEGRLAAVIVARDARIAELEGVSEQRLAAAEAADRTMRQMDSAVQAQYVQSAGVERAAAEQARQLTESLAERDNELAGLRSQLVQAKARLAEAGTALEQAISRQDVLAKRLVAFERETLLQYGARRIRGLRSD